MRSDARKRLEATGSPVDTDVSAVYLDYDLFYESGLGLDGPTVERIAAWFLASDWLAAERAAQRAEGAKAERERIAAALLADHEGCGCEVCDTYRDAARIARTEPDQ
jgi:hypothetical protein